MRYIIGIFLFGFLILPVTVQSQDSINVEEIIVTATKTEKTLQEMKLLSKPVPGKLKKYTPLKPFRRRKRKKKL